jgi:rubrerythrin
MEATIELGLESTRRNKVIADVLSQAISGELVGMSNFASLAGIIEDIHEKMEAVEHAESERQHALGFQYIAQKNNLAVVANIEGIYWKTVRDIFLQYAEKRDFIACLIIQEIMLESFAVSMYKDAGEAIGGEIGALLIETSAQEKEHLSHATEILQRELLTNRELFINKFKLIHEQVMTVLAQWTSVSDVKGHCGVCNGNCMKDDLEEIGLNIRYIRANALKTYAQALDTIGLPGEETTVWIVSLPL